MKKANPRRPFYDAVWPDWWHHHGSKIQVEGRDGNILTLSGSAARLRIIKTPNGGGNRFIIDYEIQHSADGKTARTVPMTRNELMAAFRLSDRTGVFGDGLIERYGAESAQQGGYIRWEKFLNIPCPGTGHDGDPNISLEVDERIQKAVKDLLKRKTIRGK
ncbi:MAG: hypothetical protein WC763_02975 [Candidatus Paceibacterota bacterium]